MPAPDPAQNDEFLSFDVMYEQSSSGQVSAGVQASQCFIRSQYYAGSSSLGSVPSPACSAVRMQWARRLGDGGEERRGRDSQSVVLQFTEGEAMQAAGKWQASAIRCP